MVSIDRERLVKQVASDEGFTAKPFWDIKQWTYGYGCKAPDEHATITKAEAEILLRVRLEQSIKEFYEMFPGALQDKFNDVRAEAFINMLFNMGRGKKDGSTGGLYSFKNTLSLIYDHLNTDWSAVATNLRLSKWFKQVGSRAVRITNEIERGTKE